jgi:hypothetical protein
MLSWQHDRKLIGAPALFTSGVNHSDASFADVHVESMVAVAGPFISPREGRYGNAQTVTITCHTPGATIHYTTDGTEPSAASPVYTVPIPVTVTTVLKAIAVKDGLTWHCETATYTLVVPPPVLAPTGGHVDKPLTVTLTCPAIPEATVRYTLDGSGPTDKSPVYTVPFIVTKSTCVRAKTFKPGWEASPEVQALYYFTIPLYSDNFPGRELAKAWTCLDGDWRVTDNTLRLNHTAESPKLKCPILTNGGTTFPANMCITARVRVDATVKENDQRYGVSLDMDPKTVLSHALVFATHDGDTRPYLLDEMAAWGPSIDVQMKPATWYWFKLLEFNGVLYGKVWADGAQEPADWLLTWTPPSKKTGVPALYAGAVSNNKVSFADVRVESLP